MSAHLETMQTTPSAPILRSAPMPAWAAQGWREAAFRAAAVLATGFFAFRASMAYAADPTRATLLLVLLTELFSAALLLLSRVPKTRDTAPVALACAVWAYLFCAFLRVDPGLDLIGPAVGAAICVAGGMVTLWGQSAIGTCFGVLPATRGVVRDGPYRFVRHPIYVGYFITHVGFLLSNLTLRNFLVLASLYVVQFVRVTREEAMLRQEPEYRAYCDDVPYRFCFGVY